MYQNCYKALSWVNKTNTSLPPESFYLETLNNHISFDKCKDKKNGKCYERCGDSQEGISEKVTFKLWSTWTVGKRIFQAEGIVGKTLEHCAGGVAREQKVDENERGCKRETGGEHADQ